MVFRVIKLVKYNNKYNNTYNKIYKNQRLSDVRKVTANSVKYDQMALFQKKRRLLKYGYKA